MIMVCIICHESTLERHQPRFERIYQAEGSQEQINDSCIESMRRISQVTEAEGWGGNNAMSRPADAIPWRTGKNSASEQLK